MARFQAQPVGPGLYFRRAASIGFVLTGPGKVQDVTGSQLESSLVILPPGGGASSIINSVETIDPIGSPPPNGNLRTITGRLSKASGLKLVGQLGAEDVYV